MSYWSATIDKHLQIDYYRRMALSKYQKQKNMELKKKALKLYKQGLTTREVGAILKRSRQWVWNAVDELTGVDRTS